MKPDITHKQLTTLLHYDPETGIFTQKMRWWNREPGDRVGGMTPQGYWYVGVGGKQYPAHRLAWFYVYGEWPTDDIDHINRVRDDNRWCNLRATTRSKNLHNSPRRKASGVKGVYWSNRDKSWRASIDVDYVKHNLGSFKDEQDAISARRFAEQLFGVSV